MENTALLNWITGGLAVVLLLCAFLMMFTTVFTNKGK